MEALIAALLRRRLGRRRHRQQPRHRPRRARARAALRRRRAGPARYREGLPDDARFLEECPQPLVQPHLAEDAAHRLHAAICAGVRAAERNNDRPGAPRLVLGLQGRRYSSTGSGTFQSGARVRARPGTGEGRNPSVPRRGRAATTLRRELAGFEALCGLPRRLAQD